MFRSSSDHPQGIYIKQAYIKHGLIVHEIKILGLKFYGFLIIRLSFIHAISMYAP